MRELKMMKKLSKGLLSLLLALTLLLSLGVPLTVFAEEEVAEGNEIYALVYDIRAKSSDGNSLGYELVFQRGNPLASCKVKENG